MQTKMAAESIDILSEINALKLGIKSVHNCGIGGSGIDSTQSPVDPRPPCPGLVGSEEFLVVSILNPPPYNDISNRIH